ncbi:hypothetical protein HY375_01715 [Candidatus Berkelbacteria bacterium]|nr:hypothetical protein [Candidatus Berkelbacteria bacterium]
MSKLLTLIAVVLMAIPQAAFATEDGVHVAVLQAEELATEENNNSEVGQTQTVDDGVRWVAIEPPQVELPAPRIEMHPATLTPWVKRVSGCPHCEHCQAESQQRTDHGQVPNTESVSTLLERFMGRPITLPGSGSEQQNPVNIQLLNVQTLPPTVHQLEPTTFQPTEEQMLRARFLWEERVRQGLESDPAGIVDGGRYKSE